MQPSQIALKYSKAIFFVSKNHEQVLNQLRQIVEIVNKDKSVNDFFTSHFVSNSQKFEVVKTTFENKGLNSEVLNLLYVLAEKGRLGLIFEVLKSFEVLVDNEHGVTRGEVKSAAKLGSEERKRIEDAVAKITNKKVILTFSEDEKLIGGIVTKVGGWTIEDSLDSHITRLREDLHRRAN